MSKILPIAKPLNGSDLTEAAAEMVREATSLSALAEAVKEYEAATGNVIAVVLQGTPVHFTTRAAVMEERLVSDAAHTPYPEVLHKPEDFVNVQRGTDPWRLDKREVREEAPAKPLSRTMPEIAAAAADAPAEPGKPVSDDIREAANHIRNLGPSGKWNHALDLELMERCIEGQTEKLIADVMEYSPSFIRQRFNKLVGRQTGQDNRFTREQVLDALKHIVGQ